MRTMNVGALLMKEAVIFEKAAHDLRNAASKLSLGGHATFHGNADRLVALIVEEGPVKAKKASKRLGVHETTVYDWTRANKNVFKLEGGKIALHAMPTARHS